MNPYLLLGLGVAAIFLLNKKTPAAKPQRSQVSLPPVALPPGTLTQSEVDMIQHGAANHLYAAASKSTHKLFVAAAAAKLQSLGHNAQAMKLAKRSLGLPNEEDEPEPSNQDPFQAPAIVAQSVATVSQEFGATPTIYQWTGPSGRNYLSLYWRNQSMVAQILYTADPETGWGVQITAGQVPVVLVNVVPDSAAEGDIERFVADYLRNSQ